MKITDLAQLDIKDLKNIDYSVVLAHIRKRPDILFSSVLILAVLFFCLYFYSSKKKDFSTLKTELSEIESKAAVFDEHQDIQQVLTELKSVLPKEIKEPQLIELITSCAGKNNVTINSFSPAQHEAYDVYTKITMSLELVSKSYDDLFRFVHALETQGKTIRVSALTGRSGSTSTRQTRTRRLESRPDDGSISVSLTVTAVNFKNE